MADETGKVARRRIRYFFINVDGEPHAHKVLKINRAADTLMAWDYPDSKRKIYSYSSVRKSAQNGFSVREVCEILDCNRLTVHRYIREGLIRKPAMIYALENRDKKKYIFSGDDVLELHQAMTEQHIGRPRKDGFVTSMKKMKDRATVKALVSEGQVLYTLDKDGKPVPLWKEQVW